MTKLLTPTLFAAFLFSFAQSASAVEPRELRWLEDNETSPVMGTTFGVPWPKGSVQEDTHLVLRSGEGEAVPAQTWPLAFWPDGSLKWSGVAVGPREAACDQFSLEPSDSPVESEQALTVRRDGDATHIDTGLMRATVAHSGNVLIPSVSRNGREILTGGRLVALNQNQRSEPSAEALVVKSFESRISSVEVEQDGPIRSVIKIEGMHAGEDREILPFVLRLYFYANSANIRMVHTFIYDVDEHEDFIRGLGVRFDVPMEDELYNRHIRFSSAEGGLWAEAVMGVTGLRRDPGAEVRRLQVEGQPLPPEDTWDQRVTDRFQYIPTWGDFTLSQINADGFEIRKRTAAGHGWIRSAAGTRASGMGYVGGVTGGVAFGMKDFWQSHPSQIDIRNANSESAETTLWFWAPEAKAMDLGFYHDGLGMETLHQERQGGMAITYEDYKEGMGTPYGVARTSEVNLWITDSTPSGKALLEYAEDSMAPPLLAVAPEQILESRVFGALWTLPDRSTPTLSRIEDMLDHAFELYVDQREAHRWYGFWDFGDVIHSFDPDRNMWRYDVGGYGWANSELSPDIWLWTKFLRSGRADVFRFAEAMTRHTGEVDVYHIGPQALLGTRHHVQHWGDGMKQLRISTPVYRRYFYYLTADERVGDQLRDQLDAYKTYLTYDWFSKTMREEGEDWDPRDMPMGVGQNMGIIGMGWLTEWERTQDTDYRDRLLNYLHSLGEMPFGFFSVDTYLDAETGVVVTRSPDQHVGNMSHLNMVFGYPEFAAEVLELFDVPGYKQAWLDYSTWFNADREARAEAIGVDVGTSRTLPTYYSRLTAFAAYLSDDEELAQRAWNEILGPGDRPSGPFASRPRKVEVGADSLHRFEVGRFMSTNWVSEWNNAMMQTLRFIGDYLDEDDPRTKARAPQD
ncbi:MAG: Tat pathway signal sequence domain protein [Opitutales bacterium]|nr:Tat pathway signal sequence domain protein [Opitutales bacterium]